MTTNSYYSPSFTARSARILIPILQRLLPNSVYVHVYEVLYNSYKWILRKTYLFEVFAARLFGDEQRKRRAEVTNLLLPYTMGGSKALENAFDLVVLVEENKIPGVLLECGVAEGGTAAMLALANRELGERVRRLYLFDSFEGLPEPTIEDFMDGQAGRFIRPLPKGSCLGTLEQVKELMLKTLQFKESDVTFVKGWFQDTVPAFRQEFSEPIAVLRLDGDWYESTLIPLENFYDLVSDGGVVIIDDYGTCYGSKKATDEFVSKNQLNVILHPDGRGGAWFKKPAS